MVRAYHHFCCVLASGEAAQWAAVESDHVAQRRTGINGRARFGAVQLGIRAMQIADDPFGVAELYKTTEVRLAGKLQRRQARSLARAGGLLDEPKVVRHRLNRILAGYGAVSGHERPGIERAEAVQGNQ